MHSRGSVEEHLLIGVSSIVVLGMTAQWIADRLRLPSILLLLLAGFVAGPVTGLLQPAELFGKLLPTLVGLAVAIILFDGGLSLRISEIRDVRSAVRRLITIGVLTTLVVGAAASRLLLPFDWRMSLLLAAILTVSGPTVILPLLRHMRPRGNAGSVMKWEGIFNDPVGAVLAVLIFEVIVAGGSRGELGASVVVGIARTALVGTVVGVAAALLTVALMNRYLVSHHLEIPMVIMIVVAAYAVSNLAQAESGLLAATIMGVALANQRVTPVRHIVEFGESVGILLTSVLFVVLAADLELSQFTTLGWPVVVFIAVLVLVVRPLAVALSTWRSELTVRERVVLGWMAPRGIVAASVASVFAIRLDAAGIARAELLTPYVFTVIVATATIYGLTAAPLARRLGVADPAPQGVALIGAHRWARRFAEVLEAADVRTLVIPTNRADLSASRLAGLRAHTGSILDDEGIEQVDLDGIGWVLALTHNDEFNSLAALRFMQALDRRQVLQLPADRAPGTVREVTHDLRGRLAFGTDVTFQSIEDRFAAGADVKKTRLTPEFDLDAMCQRYGGAVTPLFILRDGQLRVVSAEDDPPRVGETVIALVDQPEGVGPEPAADAGDELPV